MTYRLKCRDCGYVYTSSYRNASCPRNSCQGRSGDLLEEVLTIAAGVAIGSVAGDVIGGLFGGLFD